MALFRNEAPTLGSNATIELSAGSVSPSQLANVPVLEIVDVTGLGATSTSQSVFVAPPAASATQLPMGTYALAGVSAVFGTASSSGTLQVEKTPSGTAAGSGTNLLTGTVSLAGANNTTVNGTLVSNPNTLTLAAGDRLSLVFGGTMTNLANCAVTLYIKRVG